MEEYKETIEYNGELWARKWMDTFLSGHLHAGSDTETSDSCGNCDGALCDLCKRVYKVSVLRLPENEREEALCCATGRPLVDWHNFYDIDKAFEYFENV